MATPTDEQQIRATLRRSMRNRGADATAGTVVQESVMILGEQSVQAAILAEGIAVLGDHIPPIMGAAEAAEILGMKATNLKRLSPPLLPVATISGRIPVYTESDVMAAKARRDARRQPQLEGMEA